MEVLSKSALLERIATRPDVETAEVECPELGGAVRVRAITGTVRNRLEAAYAAISEGADGSLMDKVVIALVSACVVDEQGRPFLVGNLAADMFKHYPSACFRIRDAAVRMAGMSEEDTEELTQSFD